MKQLFSLFLLGFILVFTACDPDDGNLFIDDDEDEDPFEIVEGIWETGSTIMVTKDIIIPEGKSLTIEEGVTVIVDGTGRPGRSPEINVRGSLYCYGTAANPIYIGVEESKRTVGNIYRGLWGGIIGTETAKDLVLEYTTIEFAGAPAEPGSSIVAEGELAEGEPRYAIYWVNPEGNFIMWHSRIAYTKDDAIRLNGAKTLIAYSEFAFNGETGGESVNTKSGVVGDFCYNVFYGIATNGLKAANSKGRDPQCNNNYYNNTMVNSGWKRAQAGRGGSLNYENGARGECYNNLVVNCRYGLRLFPPDDEPDMENIRFGHNFYYGDDEEVIVGFHPDNGIIGQNLPTYEDIVIPESDVWGAIGENDPMFKGYTLGDFDPEDSKSNKEVRLITNMFETFSLLPGSPALTGGTTTEFSPIFSEYVVNGKTYVTPLPAEFFGGVAPSN